MCRDRPRSSQRPNGAPDSGSAELLIRRFDCPYAPSVCGARAPSRIGSCHCGSTLVPSKDCIHDNNLIVMHAQTTMSPTTQPIPWRPGKPLRSRDRSKRSASCSGRWAESQWNSCLQCIGTSYKPPHRPWVAALFCMAALPAIRAKGDGQHGTERHHHPRHVRG